MKILINILNKTLIFEDGETLPITNSVRTLAGGTRKSSEVVRSIPDGAPYDPQQFPCGKWRVTAVEWQKEKGFDPRTYGPVKIRTDAWRMVHAWELDAEGDYSRETEKCVKDTGYLLHYSAYNTTLGCIRFASPQDAVKCAEKIQAAWGAGEEVFIEVT
jgi:hypothetical protein